MNDTLYTVAEVAERLKVNEETVRIWLRDGKLRGIRLGSRRAGWRITESEIERMLSGGS